MISTDPTVEYVKPAVLTGKWSNAGEALSCDGKISSPQVWFSFDLGLIPAECSTGLQI